MRSVRLIELAAQAEALRLRRGATGLARQAGFQAAAAMFGLAALVLLHVAGWIWIEARTDALTAALALGAADLVVMGALLLAARPRRDPVAEEALRLRQQSLAQLSGASPVREAAGLLALRGVTSDLGVRLVEGIVRALVRR
jgi:hypothetical protein